MNKFLLYGAVWYLSGTASFVYWWTNNYNFTTSELLPAAIISVSGPIAFPIGWMVHGKPLFKKKILIEKRSE